MNFPTEESKRSTFGKFPLQRWRERRSLEEYSPTLPAKMPTIRKKGCGQPPLFDSISLLHQISLHKEHQPIK